MSDLKDRANPINGLYAALICDVQEMVIEQRITNELLVKNGEQLVTISEQKTAQANGDKTSRWLTLIGLSIAGATLYFSESPFAQGVRLWLTQLGGL